MTEFTQEMFDALGIEIPPMFNGDTEFNVPTQDPAASPGEIVVGGYNVRHTTTKAQTIEDFAKIMSMVGACGTSESRVKYRDFFPYCEKQGWDTFMQHGATDTAAIWDPRRFDVFHKHTTPMHYTLWSGKHLPQAITEVGLREKIAGKRFYLCSVHTQVHGYQGGQLGVNMRSQYRTIHARVVELNHDAPVLLIGDLNNAHVMRDNPTPVPSNWKYFTTGIDYIMYDSQKVQLTKTGSIPGVGFHHGSGSAGQNEMHSDHPFIFATARI